MKKNINFICLLMLLLTFVINESFAQSWKKTQPNILYSVDKNQDTADVRIGIGISNPLFPLQVKGQILTDSMRILGRLHIGSHSLTLGTIVDAPGAPNVIFSNDGDLYIQCENGFHTILNWDGTTNSMLGSVGIGTETPFTAPSLAGILGLEVNNDINLSFQELGHGYRLGGPVILHNFGLNNIFVGENIFA